MLILRWEKQLATVEEEAGEQTIKKWGEKKCGIKEDTWIQEAEQRITAIPSGSIHIQEWMECGQSSPFQRHQVNRGWRKSYSCREGGWGRLVIFRTDAAWPVPRRATHSLGACPDTLRPANTLQDLSEGPGLISVYMDGAWGCFCWALRWGLWGNGACPGANNERRCGQFTSWWSKRSEMIELQ